MDDYKASRSIRRAARTKTSTESLVTTEAIHLPGSGTLAATFPLRLARLPSDGILFSHPFRDTTLLRFLARFLFGEVNAGFLL